MPTSAHLSIVPNSMPPIFKGILLLPYSVKKWSQSSNDWNWDFIFVVQKVLEKLQKEIKTGIKLDF